MRMQTRYGGVVQREIRPIRAVRPVARAEHSVAKDDKDEICPGVNRVNLLIIMVHFFTRRSLADPANKANAKYHDPATAAFKCEHASLGPTV
jgi:hypothetical protein